MDSIRQSRVTMWAAVCICAIVFQPLPGSLAQSILPAVPLVPATTTDLLQQMAGQAGEIFVGHVVEIHLLGDAVPNHNFPDWPDGSRLVVITLQAEDCVIGCVTGQQVQMREWAALWRGQPHRYMPGQRAVWFLYPPNAAGITSPVNGMLGVLPVKTAAADTASASTTSVETAAAQSTPVVDLRWVQTAVLRDRAPLPTASGVHPLGEASSASEQSETQTTTEQPTAPLTTVMGVLHAFAATQTTPSR